MNFLIAHKGLDLRDDCKKLKWYDFHGSLQIQTF